MRKHRHVSVREQWKTLNQKLVGHFRYYGITGNSKALSCFRSLTPGKIPPGFLVKNRPPIQDRAIARSCRISARQN